MGGEGRREPGCGAHFHRFGLFVVSPDLRAGIEESPTVALHATAAALRYNVIVTCDAGADAATAVGLNPIASWAGRGGAAGTFTVVPWPNSMSANGEEVWYTRRGGGEWSDDSRQLTTIAIHFT